MEADRYQKHHIAYISGLFCMITSIGLFAFSLFLLPYLFFGWQYSVPNFITDFSAFLQDKHTLSNSAVAWVMCLALDLPAVILFVIADVLSNRIDKEIYGISNSSSNRTRTNEQNDADKLKAQEGSGILVVKIGFLILIIFIVAQFFHWVITAR